MLNPPAVCAAVGRCSTDVNIKWTPVKGIQSLPYLSNWKVMVFISPIFSCKCENFPKQVLYLTVFFCFVFCCYLICLGFFFCGFGIGSDIQKF